MRERITTGAAGMLTALDKAVNMDEQDTLAVITLLIEIITLVLAAIEFGTNYKRK